MANVTVDGLCPNSAALALKVHEFYSTDVYRGTAEQRGAAGMARPDMFPGQPGRRKTQCTYNDDGQLARVGPAQRGPQLVISRNGKDKFRVEWPVGEAEEKCRRRAALVVEERKREALAKVDAEKVRMGVERMRKVVSLGNAFARAFDASPSRLNVGDRPIFWNEHRQEGMEVEVIEPYAEYVVRGEGDRLGYVVKSLDDGEQFFVPAHTLLSEDYEVRHLQLVKADSDRCRTTARFK